MIEKSICLRCATIKFLITPVKKFPAIRSVTPKWTSPTRVSQELNFEIVIASSGSSLTGSSKYGGLFNGIIIRIKAIVGDVK
ncbi:hypothetical protein UFOVP29_204 [uncultured Caudovirales phage]|uniref:Uncharacterized protein n=1 Tax=uncultured Caudovirales phage TaxID=2100421 RepID=A0A6J5KNW1_9CAUD|nr:hypothetical protein UFOVP29_204 [uncultured Caudovirales phage]